MEMKFVAVPESPEYVSEHYDEKHQGRKLYWQPFGHLCSEGKVFVVLRIQRTSFQPVYHCSTIWGGHNPTYREIKELVGIEDTS